MHRPSELLPLRETLESESDILTDPSHKSFQSLMERWTDVGKQTPSAIVVPCSEQDLEKTVFPTLPIVYPVILHFTLSRHNLSSDPKSYKGTMGT